MKKIFPPKRPTARIMGLLKALAAPFIPPPLAPESARQADPRRIMPRRYPFGR